MLFITLRLFFGLTILTGVIYPLLITLIAQTLMHTAANGSFISINEHFIGSRFVGQSFTDAKYFWSRPSVVNYLPMPSGGSNLGPLNLKLKEVVDARAAKIIALHPGSTIKTIPSDLLYASASGIDPHISLQAALFQLDRVAKARNMSEEAKEKLKNTIETLTKKDIGRFFAPRHVNVLELNIDLDGMK